MKKNSEDEISEDCFPKTIIRHNTVHDIMKSSPYKKETKIITLINHLLNNLFYIFSTDIYIRYNKIFDQHSLLEHCL